MCPSGDSHFLRAARQIDPPTDRTPGIIHVAHENLLPAKCMNLQLRNYDQLRNYAITQLR
ncbi:MAG: hypothetical protein WAU78_11220 [Roseiarcus sp.]